MTEKMNKAQNKIKSVNELIRKDKNRYKYWTYSSFYLIITEVRAGGEIGIHASLRS